MKKVLTVSFVALLLAGSLTNCKKSSSTETTPALNQEEDKALVAKAGFNSGWFERTSDGKYLIEGDILLTKADLQRMAGVNASHNFIIANEEHYRTFELVNTNGGIRTITVSLGAGFPSYYSTGLDQALARYNNLNLNIRFG